MANELQSLSDLFQNRLFRIPDYQRGYAWQQQQLEDFWDDIMNLQGKRNHYTGLLSLEPLKNEDSQVLGNDYWLVEELGYQLYHVVDGQQRITTCIILLNEIVSFVRGLGANKGKEDRDITVGVEKIEDIVSKYICKKRPPNEHIVTYLFGYEGDNPSNKYIRYKVFEEKNSDTVVETYYTKNLDIAKTFFDKNIQKLYDESETNGLDAVITLYKKLTQRLRFNLHEIGDDYDTFVVFETRNNRGKKLTNLELLKNRLIYLTTLYDDAVLDEKDKKELRKKVNDAWKEVYFQLGRNKNQLLSDDEYLRAHWIIYFKYTRKRGSDYIDFLLSKFSPKGIFEKTSVPVKTEPDTITSDDVVDTEIETELPESMEVSKLPHEDISTYVESLMDVAKYWYDTYFPYESDSLKSEEKKCIDRLNRIGIGYFRPLVTAIISRNDISSESRVKVFNAIERFIFIIFRIGNLNGSYGSSIYYEIARLVYKNEKNVDELCKEIYEKTTNEIEYATQNFVTRIEKFFSSGNGYYDWNSLKYFFYEYEFSLVGENGVAHIDSWSIFTRSQKDKVSIEHILPQTPTEYYWRNQFRQFNSTEIKMLSGALGNLLPLSQSVNSSLQNNSFEDKKHTKSIGRRGYDNGSHSEIEVSKIENWTADEIYSRSKKLLDFMQQHWCFQFSPEQIDKLIGLQFVKDGRDVPPELKKADPSEGETSSQHEQFWTAFVDYAKAHGRLDDITQQKISDKNYYNVPIGASGYHLFFSTFHGKWVNIGIYTDNIDVYNHLKEKEDQIDSVFGEKLDWEYSKSAEKNKSIIIAKEVNVFDQDEQPKVFEWMFNHFDCLIKALAAAGEKINASKHEDESVEP